MLDPRTELANNHVHVMDPVRPLNHIHDNCRGTSIGARARRASQNYENYRNSSGGGLQLRPDYMEEEPESGVCSPPLWKTSPSGAPLQARHPQTNYRHLSPASRDEAIARGQWELMEMVKNMPESSYELSLRDLVQHNKMEAKEECLAREKSVVNNSQQKVEAAKRQGSKKNDAKVIKMSRSGSMDNRGLFLKMVFPVSICKASPKKKNLATNTCAKVSPKPEASDRSSKSGEREWWKKRFSISSDGESGGSSSTSSRGSSHCNSSRKRSGSSHGCWPFFHTKKSKSAT